MPLTSPIYWSPWIYRATMRALYGAELDERYRVVDRLVPDGARVVELCCGCGYLYEHFLRKRAVHYYGIDLLPRMTSRLRQLGARVEQADVMQAAVPAADYVLMLGSLYHFHPHESRLLRKMAGSGIGIVIEPVRNRAQDSRRFVRLVAQALTFISGTRSDYRLTPERFEAVLAEADLQILHREEPLGGRYRLAMFTKCRPMERTNPAG